MKKTISLLLLFISVLFYSQVIEKNYTFRTKEEVKSFSEDVMNSFSKKDFKNAYAILRMKWILPENELDQLEGLTMKQMNMVTSRYGEIVGYEFYKDLAINETLLRKIYILKFENSPIIFSFTYYNSGKGWILNGFKYSDEADILQF
ncbi:hypothetical protein GCM10010992_11310 [Cloacibacterium rupense]|uniref:DUF3887 domain-containing protein n=1 Tax=Cloacibacterium rupense TaxID=517423 RepID=A0ABQ2NI18_9FLAO|nr:hypothetical protein [Cloacibacterium rupense]GGP03332.1 hypothetical protein GCM10010992_11310 [Cloacibacterium rupense]